MTERQILLGFAVDIFGPMAAYWITTWIGVPVFWGLALGGGVAIVSTVANSIRRKKIDGVGILVLLEVATAIGLSFLTNDSRLLLIRPSFYTVIAAIYLMVNAFTTQPLSFQASKPMATKGDPIRTIAWERAWNELPQFRLAHKVLTFGWGVASLSDSVLRVIVVYRFPADRAAWLSNVPHIAGVLIMISVSALFGRWAGSMVDSIEQRLSVSGEDRPQSLPARRSRLA